MIWHNSSLECRGCFTLSRCNASLGTWQIAHGLSAFPPCIVSMVQLRKVIDLRCKGINGITYLSWLLVIRPSIKGYTHLKIPSAHWIWIPQHAACHSKLRISPIACWYASNWNLDHFVPLHLLVSLPTTCIHHPFPLHYNQTRENGQSCNNWVASYWTKGRKFRFISININPDQKTFDIVNFPCSTILLHVLETGYGINEILHPCIPEIIPSPWLINVLYPSVITMLDKNLFGIPVNVVIKIGVLKDLFYPVHGWFSTDFHCPLEVAELNCDQCCL